MTRGASAEQTIGDWTLVYEGYKPRRERLHEALCRLRYRRQLLEVEADHEVLRISSGAFTTTPITLAYRGHYRDVAPGDTYEFRLTKPQERDRDENRAGRSSARAATDSKE